MDTRAFALDDFALDDEQLLEELGWVRAVAGRLLADPNDADDVVQETWLRTRQASVQFESRGRLRAWLAGVAQRMARDTLRARHRRARREERAAREEARADAEDVVERSGALQAMLQAVRALDEPQRSTVLLRYLDGYSTSEIASAMAISEDLVRKRLTRARAILRERLAADPRARAQRRAAHVSVLRRTSVAGALLVALLGLYWLGPSAREDERMDSHVRTDSHGSTDSHGRTGSPRDNAGLAERGTRPLETELAPEPVAAGAPLAVANEPEPDERAHDARDVERDGETDDPSDPAHAQEFLPSVRATLAED